ncbi:MAG TPA: I78 family peptidase inhibitor [Pseudomonas sp.]|nr:I78 family peptidase inhibitor [Pseudomonas sp.]
MNRSFILTCALLALAGCSAAGPQDAQVALDSELCKAGPAQFALGESLSEELEEAARKHAGAKEVRVLRAGEATTLEFNAERLNLHVDDDGMVTDARCG